jgi:hypothetical protein
MLVQLLFQLRKALGHVSPDRYAQRGPAVLMLKPKCIREKSSHIMAYRVKVSAFFAVSGMLIRITEIVIHFPSAS